MSYAQILDVIDAGGSVALAVIVWFTLRWGFAYIGDRVTKLGDQFGKQHTELREDMREDRREVLDATKMHGERLAQIDERTITIVKQTRPRASNGG